MSVLIRVSSPVSCRRIPGAISISPTRRSPFSSRRNRPVSVSIRKLSMVSVCRTSSPSRLTTALISSKKSPLTLMRSLSGEFGSVATASWTRPTTPVFSPIKTVRFNVPESAPMKSISVVTAPTTENCAVPSSGLMAAEIWINPSSVIASSIVSFTEIVAVK